MHPASEAYAHWITGAIDDAKILLDETRKRMGQYTDPRRMAAPHYDIGDAVMLSSRNLRIKRPSRSEEHTSELQSRP